MLLLLLLMLTLSTVMVVVDIGVVNVTTTDLSSPSAAAAASALCCSTVGTLSTAAPDGGRFFFFCGGTDGTSLTSRRTAGGVSVAAVADVSTLSVGNSQHSHSITTTTLDQIINTLVYYTAFLNEPFPINTPIRGNNPPEQALI